LEVPAEADVEEVFALRVRRLELESYGVDVERLLAGAAVAAFGHHIPQINIAILARAIKRLGMEQPMRARFVAMSSDRERSWSNRFRARLLVAYLDGTINLTDAGLGWDRSAGPYFVEQLGRFVRTEIPGDASSRELDEACAWNLLGVGDNWCTAG
jgi:hypothetical protein